MEIDTTTKCGGAKLRNLSDLHEIMEPPTKTKVKKIGIRMIFTNALAAGFVHDFSARRDVLAGILRDFPVIEPVAITRPRP